MWKGKKQFFGRLYGECLVSGFGGCHAVGNTTPAAVGTTDTKVKGVVTIMVAADADADADATADTAAAAVDVDDVSAAICSSPVFIMIVVD